MCTNMRLSKSKVIHSEAWTYATLTCQIYGDFQKQLCGVRVVWDWHLHKWNITFTWYAYWQEMGWETRWRYCKQGLPNLQAFSVAKFLMGRQTVSRCSCSDHDRLFFTGSQIINRRFLWWPKLDVFQPEAGPYPGVFCVNHNWVFFRGSQTISRCFCGNQHWVVLMGSRIISSRVFADQNQLIFKAGWTISRGVFCRPKQVF